MHTPEVSLAGRGTLHGLVVGVEMGVVVDFQRLGAQGGGDLRHGTAGV